MIEHLSIPTPAGHFDAIAAGPADGRPVLLLHGFPQAGICWEHQVAVLGSRGYRAVAPDLRGYSPGVRPEAVAEYGVTSLVGDVLAIADQLGCSRFDLVGHDLGALVAWWTAAEHGDRLRTLTAVSTPHPGALAHALLADEDQQMRSGYLRDWRDRGTEKRMLANNAEALRRMFEWKVPRSRVDEYVLRMSEPGALTAALAWYRASRPESAIGKVDAPTLYVWSTEDVAFGSVAAFETEHWVTSAYTFQMLEDVTHWVPEEAPETLTALLLEHLAAY
ncbi:MAG TPA: alpha/beta hydrolase [Amycolatopsis sp.]|nr:alpha/beta hydrolase [Amycolatopsis sp.]